MSITLFVSSHVQGLPGSFIHGSMARSTPPPPAEYGLIGEGKGSMGHGVGRGLPCPRGFRVGSSPGVVLGPPAASFTH